MPSWMTIVDELCLFLAFLEFCMELVPNIFDYLGAWTWWPRAHCRTCPMHQTCPRAPFHKNILQTTQA